MIRYLRGWIIHTLNDPKRKRSPPLRRLQPEQVWASTQTQAAGNYGTQPILSVGPYVPTWCPYVPRKNMWTGPVVLKGRWPSTGRGREQCRGAVGEVSRNRTLLTGIPKTLWAHRVDR